MWDRARKWPDVGHMAKDGGMRSKQRKSEARLHTASLLVGLYVVYFFVRDRIQCPRVMHFEHVATTGFTHGLARVGHHVQYLTRMRSVLSRVHRIAKALPALSSL